MGTDLGARPLAAKGEAGVQEDQGNGVTEERLAPALGWFSIGLGLAGVAAPKGLGNLIGVGDRSALLRLVGLREIATGVGILTQHGSAGWLWSRVAGDAMDLTLLGAALTSGQTKKSRVAVATAAVAGVTALDLLCSQRLSRDADDTSSDNAVTVRRAITIGRSREELYRFWRDFENLPRFMRHLESVRLTGEGRSHWVAKAPAGTTVEWEAEILEDRPNELIAWRSVEGSEVETSGSVRFEPAPGDRGTTVKVEMIYSPPGGVLGAAVATLFGEEPNRQVEDDLRAFKQVIEVGEVVQSDGSLPGAGAARPHAR